MFCIYSRYFEKHFPKESSTNNFSDPGDDSASNDRFSAKNMKSKKRPLPKQSKAHLLTCISPSS